MMSSSSAVINDRKRKASPSDMQPSSKRLRQSEQSTESIAKLRAELLAHPNKYESYITSNHDKYDDSKSWKIFNEDDAPSGTITPSQCKICDKSFKNAKGKSSHVSTSRDHQLNLLKHYLSTDLSFPRHFVMKQIAKTSKAHKNRSIFSFFPSSKMKANKPNTTTKDITLNEIEDEEDYDQKAQEQSSKECKGYHIEQLFFNLPPFTLQQYRVKISSNSLHHQNCPIQTKEESGISNECRAYFTIGIKGAIAKKLQCKSKKFNNKYLSRTELLQKHQLQKQMINAYKLKQLNLNSRILTLSGKNWNYQQLLGVIQEFDAPRLRAVINQHLHHNKSIESLLMNVTEIVNSRRYKLKNLNQFEIRLTEFILSVAGPKVVGVLNRLGMCASAKIARKSIKQHKPPFISGKLSIKNVLDSLQILLTSESPNNVWGLSVDFVYGNKMIGWNAASNEISGLCIEHCAELSGLDNTSTTFNTFN